jgi:hypothetical protein
LRQRDPEEGLTVCGIAAKADYLRALRQCAYVAGAKYKRA